MPDLGTRVGQLRLASPVVVAAGAQPLETLPDWPGLATLGAVVTKGITVLPRPGNPRPRLARLPVGLVNSVGLENPGLDWLVDRYLPRLLGVPVPVVVNVAPFGVDEAATLALGVATAASLDPRLDLGLELNLSCPNVHAGAAAGSDPALAAETVAAARSVWSGPLWAKLPPLVPDLLPVARAAVAAGADAVTLTNTLPALTLGPDLCPALGGGSGGLSGPAAKPVALAHTWRVAPRLAGAVIGCGGVASGRDAAEYLAVGARAVAVATAALDDPAAPARIVQELGQLLTELGLDGVDQLVGRALAPEVTANRG